MPISTPRSDSAASNETVSFLRGLGLREALGMHLRGAVLEIGPGHKPFPTAEGAQVTFADRSVPGGRDATWPELAGEPHGPQADLDINLDSDALRTLADASFDAAVASHVIEHLANPQAVLADFARVLRPGGCLVLVVPDRTLTFDAPRPGTTYAHLRAEFDGRVTEVDDEHIREFCAAVFSQPPLHPPMVREWHDPDLLDAERFDLFRRRSVHAHCWTPEEFASLIAASIVDDVMTWRLRDLYVAEDFGEIPGNEFGLALERPSHSLGPIRDCDRFVSDWTELVLSSHRRDPLRADRFVAALHRDLSNGTGARALAHRPHEILSSHQTVALSHIAQRDAGTSWRRTLEVAGITLTISQSRTSRIAKVAANTMTRLRKGIQGLR